MEKSIVAREKRGQASKIWLFGFLPIGPTALAQLESLTK
jgi:hypothetical protein